VSNSEDLGASNKESTFFVGLGLSAFFGASNIDAKGSEAFEEGVSNNEALPLNNESLVDAFFFSSVFIGTSVFLGSSFLAGLASNRESSIFDAFVDSVA
jgi:hypothetical protein